MQVSCPSCQSSLLYEEMSQSGGLVTCQRCHAQVNMQEAADAERHREAGFSRQEGTDVTMPAGMTLDVTDSGVRIVYRWYTSRFLVLAMTCLFWDFYLIRLYTSSFVKDSPWVLVLFPLIHVVVGIGLTYYTLAGFLNQTTISIEGGMMKIRHAPLPWFGNVALQLDSLRQFYVEQKTHHTRTSTSFSYQVLARVSGGRNVVIVSGLPEMEQARFIEQLLETCLGIEDRPVHGETVR